ncbi:MAG: glycoside hydrolase family 13 protein, partial [Roseburia sp.]|nr:glycoside hydrolase family 13 protein [Roseburia sp.]
MEYSAIFHDMDKRFCYAIDKDVFVIRVQVKKDDMKEIILHYEDKYIPMERKDTRKTISMKKVVTSQFHDYYEAQLQMHLICLRYFFEFIDTHGEKVYYGNYEFNKDCITNRDRMFDCPQNLREEEMFEVPQWAANKVVYQIFPSRFAASQPVDKELWYKAPITHMDDLHGNLRGIIEHLDYIENLGIDILYMTPIFKSNSCHKYDTIDYYQVDPSFGTTEDLRELVQKAHERGMKVVLDAVYNHTGRDFFAFQDILEKGEKSRYLDWYFIDELPPKDEMGEIPNFKCFGYYGGMPKLNLKNPEVEKYITDVACYWIKECDIDGWRMDVGDEISHFFWKNFRKAIKAVKKDMLIIGEIWHYAGDFLEGDEWDTVMNYPFYLNMIDLLADTRINVSQFVQNLGYLKGRLNKKC